jgi:hypothetical protein
MDVLISEDKEGCLINVFIFQCKFIFEALDNQVQTTNTHHIHYPSLGKISLSPVRIA